MVAGRAVRSGVGANRYIADMMLNNDLGFLWSERFRDGYHETVERFLYGDTVTTEVCAQDAPEGEISPGLLGFYGRWYFRLCCPLFGCFMEDQEPGEQADAIREEAYGLLERSVALLEKWYAIPDGSALEVGNPDVFGGIRAVKGEDTLLTPDGRKEMLSDYDIQYALNPGRGICSTE